MVRSHLRNASQISYLRPACFALVILVRLEMLAPPKSEFVRIYRFPTEILAPGKSEAFTHTCASTCKLSCSKALATDTPVSDQSIPI